uniref:Uncharacterized protein n=1 Tax=Acrobeloides nanus TaxID=290746 RepID=A0A914CTF1_9BILA
MHPALIIAATFPNTVGKLPFFRGYINKLMQHAGVMFGYFDKQIEQHEKCFDPNSAEEEGKDFVEVYLKEIYKMKDKDGHYFTYVVQLR